GPRSRDGNNRESHRTTASGSAHGRTRQNHRPAAERYRGSSEAASAQRAGGGLSRAVALQSGFLTRTPPCLSSVVCHGRSGGSRGNGRGSWFSPLKKSESIVRRT